MNSKTRKGNIDNANSNGSKGFEDERFKRDVVTVTFLPVEHNVELQFQNGDGVTGIAECNNVIWR